MNKFAIYTACIGGYDNILQPEVTDERFDYFLFTNDVKEEKVGVWQVQKVEYTNPDMTRIARYVKTHPEELLPEYEATLWMDANVQIISTWVYERFIELYEQGTRVACIQHPERDCIYDEAYKVSSYTIFGALEHEKIALVWCRKIWKEKYPMHRGLYETNILYRKKTSLVKNVNNTWWKCINKYSKRDQLSFNYSLWKNGIVENCYFLPEGEHAQNSSNVKYISHQHVSQRKQIRLNLFERIRYRYKSIQPERSILLWNDLITSSMPISFALMFETIVSIGVVFLYKTKKLLCRRTKRHI